MDKKTEHVKCLIIGSGPAGYTAAIYTGRANINPLMYQGMEPGGQLMTTTEVENFPGYPEGVDGPKMMEDLRIQAERFGLDNRFGLATSVDFSGPVHKVTIDENKIIEADAVIISTGASAKWLGLESEKRLQGGGVSACAVCDVFFYKGQDVALVGGGDTAAEEALYLSKICNKVHMIVRRDELRASRIMQQRVFDTSNIEMHWDTSTEEVLGDQVVEGARLVNNKIGEKSEIAITGFFVAIGHKPNTDIFKDWLDMDELGYLKVQAGSTKTNIPGVFAAGDVADRHYRQAVTAAGTGCMAALDAERYLSEKGVG